MNGSLARRSLPILLIVGLGCGRGAAQQGYQHVIPGDAVAFLGVDSMTMFEDGYAQSPLGQLWKDPALEPLRTVLATHLQEWRDRARAQLGVDPFNLPGMMEGPFAVAMLDIPRPGERAVAAGGQPPGGLPSPLAACLLADVGAHREECRALMTTLTDRLATAAGLQASTERMGGDDVRVLVAPGGEPHPQLELRETFHGNVLVVTVRTGDHTTADMQRLLDGLDGRAHDALSDNPVFAASLAGGSDLPSRSRLWVDTKVVTGHLLGGEGAAGGPDAKTHDMLRSLGLGDLGAFSASSRCAADGSHLAVRLDWSGNGWIPRIAQKLCQPGAFHLLRYVPADCRSVKALHADYGGLFDATVKMLIDTRAVTASEVVSALAECEEKLGFNPRDDLLELLDGETVFVASEVEPEDAFIGTQADPQNFTLLLGLKDGAGLRALVDHLINQSAFRAAIHSVDWNGHKIFSLPLIPHFAVSYAILDDTAVISLSPHLIEQVLRIHDDHSLPALASSPTFVEMSGKLRQGFGMLGYDDAAGAFRGLIKTLSGLPEILAAAAAADEADGDSGTDGDETLPTGEQVTTIGGVKVVMVDPHAHHRPIALGEFDWLMHLPLPDPSIADKYFHGAAVSAMHVDASGMQIESVGP